MKLVDILFVLSAAATTNAILIPTGNDGSLQASGTSSQVSGSTNEPIPQIPEDDWQEIMDMIHSKNPNQDQQQPIDVVDPNIFSQVSGSTNEPIPQIPEDDWQEIMDIIHSKNPNQDQQKPIDVVDPSTSRRGRKRPIDELGPSTSKKVWKNIINKPDPGIPEDWRELIDEVNSNIDNQDQQQPTDQPSPNTSSQNQQQPIDEDESANTVTNQIAVLRQRYQKTLDRLRKRLASSKEIQDKKHKEYYDYESLGWEHRSALEMGKDVSESTYDPKVEKKLKQEYREVSTRVYSIRQQLKKFMKRHGLKFQKSDLD
ncbi:hypothetical protein O5D80_006321 [Batrachochytrium dendrobatidis]|nr:hypothetical protein O5D80_006321 [Batrachochytrium dendrobatidis]